MVLKSKYVMFGLLSILILCCILNKGKENFEANSRKGRPFTYMGLFTDKKSRDLPTHVGEVAEPTPLADVAKCHVMCKDYKYFGLQYFGECWCGNTHGKYGEKKENGKKAKFEPGKLGKKEKPKKLSKKYGYDLSKHVNKYSGGYAAHQKHSDFEEAKKHCIREPKCNAITKEGPNGKFTLRRGTSLQASPSGETSWKKTDLPHIPDKKALTSQDKLELKVKNFWTGKTNTKVVPCKPGVYNRITESGAYGTNSNCSAKDRCNVEINDKCQARIYLEDRCISARSKYKWSNYINPGESVSSSKYCSLTTIPRPTPEGEEKKRVYKHKKKGCVSGHNIKKHKNKTVEECEKLCDEYGSKCKGFEYGVAYGGGGSYKPGDCQLQSSSNTRGCSGGHYNLDFYEKTNDFVSKKKAAKNKRNTSGGRDYGGWQNYVFENHSYRKN